MTDDMEDPCEGRGVWAHALYRDAYTRNLWVNNADRRGHWLVLVNDHGRYRQVLLTEDKWDGMWERLAATLTPVEPITSGPAKPINLKEGEPDE